MQMQAQDMEKRRLDAALLNQDIGRFTSIYGPGDGRGQMLVNLGQVFPAGSTAPSSVGISGGAMR